MKRILVTGKNSYVGGAVKKYLEQWPKKYHVEELDVKGAKWRKFDFSRFDVIFHVAGIAHVDTKKADEKTKKLYYQVNTDLAEAVAKKAREDGVKQFIYMSSSIVYGDSAPIGKKKVVKKKTEPAPVNFYGDSKLQAEIKLKRMADKKFKIVLLRPPMIYGANCKGNYQILRKIALKSPIFPKIENSRSMIYIDNFAEFVKQIIDNQKSGCFYPANKEVISTYEMVKQIAECYNRRVFLMPGLEWLFKLFSHFTPIINKAFGSMTYDKDLSENYDYCHYSVKDSIKEIERGM